MKDIRTIKEIVENLLKDKPLTKDNDSLLVIEVWKIELMANYSTNPEKISLQQFFDLYLQGKLTNHESITRSRRKLQEEILELRGDNFNKRHNYTEEIKHQVKTFFKTCPPIEKITPIDIKNDPVIVENKIVKAIGNVTKHFTQSSLFDIDSEDF